MARNFLYSPKSFLLLCSVVAAAVIAWLVIPRWHTDTVLVDEEIDPEWETQLVRNADTENSLADLKSLPFLTGLTLKAGSFSDAALVHLARIRELRTLILDDTAVSDTGISYLRPLSELRRLSLGNTRIGDEGVRHLAGLTKLQGLDLHNTQITDAALSSLSGLTALKELHIQNTAVTAAGMGTLKKLAALKVLSVGGSCVDTRCFSKLGDLAGLEELYVDGADVADEALLHLAQLKNLRTLRLDGTKVDGSGLKHLTSKGLAALRVLSLASLDQEKSPAPYLKEENLAFLKQFPQLEHLGLSGTRTGQVGLSHVAKLSKLTSLYLGNCPLDDVAVRHLAALADLEFLNVQGTRATLEGLGQLRNPSVEKRHFRRLRESSSEPPGRG